MELIALSYAAPTNPRAQEGLRRFGLPGGILGYSQVEKWLKDDTNAFDLDENVCLEAAGMHLVPRIGLQRLHAVQGEPRPT